jgi:hypothetical protein
MMLGPDHKSDMDELKTAALSVLAAQVVVAAIVGLTFALMQ